jgi:hypothetical protein
LNFGRKISFAKSCDIACEMNDNLCVNNACESPMVTGGSISLTPWCYEQGKKVTKQPDN